MFARILANTADDEAGANPELAKAKQAIKELWAELAPAEGRLVDTNARAVAAENLRRLALGTTSGSGMLVGAS
jgi:CelD/BcsL family acetyltransferase involved in cellulose biosynthesis